jgi:hypothetical protein
MGLLYISALLNIHRTNIARTDFLLNLVMLLFFIFLLLLLEHRASVKSFVSLQFLDLIDRR